MRTTGRLASLVAPLVAGVAALALASPTAAPPSAAAPASRGTSTTGASAEAGAWPSGPLARPRMRRVVAISIDGLNPEAIDRVGPTGAPTLHRLMDEGVSTLEARTAVEQTVTLPNHTGMVTSRRIETPSGHGMDVNDDPGGTVSSYAGHRVGSVFSRLDGAGRKGGLYVSKSKLDILHRSWRGGISRYVVDDSTTDLVGAVRHDLVKAPKPFSFVHLGLPDQVGHASGFMSETYLDAVRHVDRVLGQLLDTLDSRPRLERRTTILLTSDHGGEGSGHSDATVYANYRVAFLGWGAGVARGRDLYALNPQLRDPGTSRPAYAARRQPVRNAAIGNLALDLLGLGPIAGSGVNADQSLRLR